MSDGTPGPWTRPRKHPHRTGREEAMSDRDRLRELGFGCKHEQDPNGYCGTSLHNEHDKWGDWQAIPNCPGVDIPALLAVVAAAKECSEADEGLRTIMAAGRANAVGIASPQLLQAARERREKGWRALAAALERLKSR